MKVYKDEKARAELLGQIAEREFHGERTGVHCSDLVYCLNKQSFRKLLPLEETEEEILLFSLGWMSQRWLTHSWEDTPTITKDGIQVTPDAVWSGGNPWELKATYTSSEKDILENTAWIHQVMSQCIVLGKREAYLSRMELMGNWKMHAPKGWADEHPDEKFEWKRPTLSVFHFEFSPAELGKHWDWMLARKELYLDILASGKYLPKAVSIPSGQEFECGYCRYKELCDSKLGES